TGFATASQWGDAIPTRGADPPPNPAASIRRCRLDAGRCSRTSDGTATCLHNSLAVISPSPNRTYFLQGRGVPFPDAILHRQRRDEAHVWTHAHSCCTTTATHT